MKCFECDSIENLVEHHVIPRSVGGKRTISLCQICHDKVHDVKKPRNISLSELTKRGLQTAKSNGVRLGTRNPERQSRLMVAANIESCRKFAETVLPIIKEIQMEGNSTLQSISDCLIKRGIKTRTGKSIWYPAQVRNIFNVTSIKDDFVWFD